jgi:hypothetical protein
MRAHLGDAARTRGSSTDAGRWAAGKCRSIASETQAQVVADGGIRDVVAAMWAHLGNVQRYGLSASRCQAFRSATTTRRWWKAGGIDSVVAAMPLRLTPTMQMCSTTDVGRWGI